MKASISIYKNLPISKIDRRIFSSFVEHMGRCVYGGIYDPVSVLSNDCGFRTDVLDLVNDLSVPMVRYPGGNFVSGYKWEDGIGPIENRPSKIDLAWSSIETNRIGTDEFMYWSKLANVDTMMAVNLGTRGIQEACDLLEYCNLDSNTYWVNKRKSNGHHEPYKIKTWCLGNEMDGPWQTGHKTALDYGKLANETAKSMKKMDPSIELVVCGSSNEFIETFGYWEETVLMACYDNVDYISMHQYYDHPNDDTAHHLAKSIRMDNFISSVKAICDSVKAKRKSAKTMMISFDEWNVWYHSNPDNVKLEMWEEAPRLLEDIYTFEDALLVGLSLITLLKHADRVKIACMAQLVNVIAPIFTNEEGSFRQTIFFPLQHAAKYGYGNVITNSIESPTYQTAEFSNVPYLEAITIDNLDGNYTILAVNRNLEESIQLNLELEGLVGIKVVEHVEYHSMDTQLRNSFEHELEPVINTTSLSNTIEIKPLSWNVIRIRKEEN